LFQPVRTYPSAGFGAAGGTAIVVVDVNGDGKADVVEVTLCNPRNCNATVGVLLGNGDGTFQPVKTVDLGSVFAISVAVGDLNSDGKPDLAVTSGGSTGGSCPPIFCSNIWVCIS
jgi:hypothetical protein